MLARQRRSRLTTLASEPFQGRVHQLGPSRSCNSGEGLQPLAIHHRHEPEPTLLKQALVAGLDLLRRKKVSGKMLVHKGHLHKIQRTRPTNFKARAGNVHSLSDNDKARGGEEPPGACPAPVMPSNPASPAGRTPHVWAMAYDWLLCVWEGHQSLQDRQLDPTP
jgi:hypothetical protein